MLMMIVVLLLSALATEAMVEVVIKGKVFDSPRSWVYSKFSEESFIGKLIRCPYCLSFWFAAFTLALWFIPFHNHVIWFLYAGWLCVQRLSNVMNDKFDKLYYSQYGPQAVVIKGNESST